MKRPVLIKLLLVLAGGIMILGYAPYHYYLTPFLSLSVLLYFWTHAKSPREAFIFGYLFGFAMFGIGVNWLHISINLFGGVNLVGALFFTYLLVAFISLYPALCGYLMLRFFNECRLFAFVPLWLLTEWCRGWFLTGFPWLNIGTSQTDSPLASYAPLVGDYGISFITCLIVSAFVCVFIGNKKQRLISGVCLVTITLCSFLLTNIQWTTNKGTDLDVALIQGGIPQELKWKPEQRAKTYAIYTGLSEPYWDSDLIIWPETAIPSLYNLAEDFIVPIDEKKQQNNALLMTGLAYKDQQDSRYYNSVLLIDDQHRFYHKHHLVPFGEYLPLKPFLGALLHFLKIPMSDFSAGEPDQKTFETEKGVFGMSICYEDAYSTEIRASLPEAELLINVSNDAWFGDSVAPHQHLQIARMRALESGRYLLRSTNTGVSAIIDPKGNIISRSPQFKPHALSEEVSLYQGATPYILFGNIVVLILSVLMLGISYRLQRRE